ncbi:MAG TPA: hypothetical protein DCG75_17160 [Bacteroidales bacterium]|nr:hypothetical protein [Bacteroidales bacterium]
MEIQSIRQITHANTRSTKMRGFGSLLTKFYLSKIVQRWTMKQGAKPAQFSIAGTLANIAMQKSEFNNSTQQIKNYRFVVWKKKSIKD